MRCFIGPNGRRAGLEGEVGGLPDVCAPDRLGPQIPRESREISLLTVEPCARARAHVSGSHRAENAESGRDRTSVPIPTAVEVCHPSPSVRRQFRRGGVLPTARPARHARSW